MYVVLIVLYKNLKNKICFETGILYQKKKTFLKSKNNISVFMCLSISLLGSFIKFGKISFQTFFFPLMSSWLNDGFHGSLNNDFHGS